MSSQIHEYFVQTEYDTRLKHNIIFTVNINQPCIYYTLNGLGIQYFQELK